MKSLKQILTETIRFVLPLGILGMGVFAFAAIASRREPPQRIERPSIVTTVETAAVEAHPGGLDFLVDGTVVPHREIAVSAEVAGRVTAKTADFRAGRYVTAGTLLVEIDPRKYELEVRRLTEEVEQAAVTLQELAVDITNTSELIALAEEDLALQKRDLERMQQLHARRTISESEVDTARRAELASRNSLATLQNQLRSLQTRQARLKSAEELARARLAQAQLDLDRTQVRAPIDGVIVSEAVEMDTYVKLGDPLFTIEDTSAAEVRCSLRMDELNWIWLQDPNRSLGETDKTPQRDYHLPKTPVTVSYKIGEQRYSWSGVLSRYESIGLDEKTRTVPCRVLVPNPRDVQVIGEGGIAHLAGPRALVRGMYVQVTVHAAPQVTLLRIPERAVQPGNVVWRVEKGALNRVQLKHLRPLDDAVLVPGSFSLLQAGDEVVVTPLAVAAEGMPVQKVEPTIVAGEPEAAGT